MVMLMAGVERLPCAGRTISFALTDSFMEAIKAFSRAWFLAYKMYALVGISEFYLEIRLSK